MSNFARRRLMAIRLLLTFSSAMLLPGWLTTSLQGQSIEVPSGTPLWIQLPSHSPMKAGRALTGSLLYPVYLDNEIALPAGTLLTGKVLRLEPDRSRRLHARLRGDFTPFDNPVVQFFEIVLPDGKRAPMAANSAKDGFPVLHLSPAPGQKKGSFLSRQIAQAKQQVKDTAALFTAPGRGDRLVQFVYTQLPYHPQRIETGTTWTVELEQRLVLELKSSAEAKPRGVAEPGAEWELHAYFERTLSSASEKAGDTFRATVAEPVFSAQHTLEVPQGSLIVGEITQAKRARTFGRRGKLRFKFRELKFPDGFAQPVETTLAGIDANKAANLQVDSEGGIQQKSQNRVIVPLVLTLLAGRAFDDDGSRIAHSAVASNGFGVIGRVVGILASSRNVAAAIGVYGAALSFYDLWLAHGHDVVFAKNTRIEITTSPSRRELPAH